MAIVLKVCKHLIVKPLTYIINLSLKSGVFPEELKPAKIIPLPKSGDTSDVKNRRPVSILNIFSKLFEKSIYVRLLEYLTSQNLLSECQHGFLKNRSTESAIASFTEKIYKSLNDTKVAGAVYIDFSKAFDCLEHNILLKKLEKYGIFGNNLKSFKSYVDNRS